MRYWQVGLTLDGSRLYSVAVGVHSLSVTPSEEGGWDWNVVNVNADSVASGSAPTLEAAQLQAEHAFEALTAAYEAYLAGL